MRLTPLCTSLLAAAVLLPSAGCTRMLNDATAITISGTPPAPEPEPEPEPPKMQLVEVTEDAIVIKQKIQFEFGKADIKEESHPLLNEIVSVLQSTPRIKKVSVEGHTDSVGSDKANQKLSEERAASVVAYLTEKGVDASRLTSKGFGESKPLDEADTDAARAKNRRVEFKITEQDQETTTYEVDPETGERREVKKG